MFVSRKGRELTAWPWHPLSCGSHTGPWVQRVGSPLGLRAALGADPFGNNQNLWILLNKMQF